MNADIKRQWLAALRSGEYQQGRGLLRNLGNDSYCCLGVLCEIHRLTVGGEWEDEFYYGNAETLPPEVSEWAGVDEMPAIDGNGLIAFNDGRSGLTVPDIRPHTFAEIADLIERHL